MTIKINRSNEAPTQEEISSAERELGVNMQTQIADDHPKQKLIFFVAQDIDNSIRFSVREMLAKLAKSRQWVIEPPRFIDITDDARSRTGDGQDETLGGEYEIYSALTPNPLPRNIDLLHLEEVEQIVKAVQQFSYAKGLAFEFELDGKYVGTVEDGAADVTLTKGLLGEWRNHLAVPPP
jgi:hypothetical protein